MSLAVRGPLQQRQPGMPGRVSVYEVGPRDGLQAERESVPTPVKIELCERLLAAGTTMLELTSFVPPTWVPQLADAAEVVAAVTLPDAARGVVLVPNLTGFQRAVDAGAQEVAVVVSASEAFARANLNTSRSGAIDRALLVVDAAAAGGIPVRGYVSMAFGDPWEGAVAASSVAQAASALFGAGCGTVALGDTIGVGTPGLVTRIVGETLGAGVPLGSLALHLHDTYGQALANVYAALQLGVSEFDASIGGLGRCPYAPGATGNLATEELVWLLDGLGIATGLNLSALAETTGWLEGVRGVRAPSRVAAALNAAR